MDSVELPESEKFERDKLSYEQNFEQFRAMNAIMWQVPVLAITITGGFWYAAIAVPESADMSRWLFLICGALDLALIWVLIRIRYVMGCYLKQLEAFHPVAYVRAPGTNLLNGKYSVVVAFSLALLVASGLSFLSFLKPGFMNG